MDANQLPLYVYTWIHTVELVSLLSNIIMIHQNLHLLDMLLPYIPLAMVILITSISVK